MTVKRKYAPKQGDIIYTDFDPAAGKEQNLDRPALVEGGIGEVINIIRLSDLLIVRTMLPVLTRLKGTPKNSNFFAGAKNGDAPIAEKVHFKRCPKYIFVGR